MDPCTANSTNTTTTPPTLRSEASSASSSSSSPSLASDIVMNASAVAAAAVAALEMKSKVEMLQTASPMAPIPRPKKCALKSKNVHKNNISKNLPKSAKKCIKTTTTITTKTITTVRSTRAPKERQLQQQKSSFPTQNLYQKQAQVENQDQQQQQQISQQPQETYQPTTKEKFLLTLDLLAVVRRNASDKLKLIQMVHDNPILWDSRLPNFKGAEEEKNRAWELIGKEFNAPGRRVARAFKSLRESYRRELAHVKLMGSGFKPKWSLYDAMDFLRDVIRERKGGSHSTVETTSSNLGLNLSAFSQHLNNNNSNSLNNNHHSRSSIKIGPLQHASFNDAVLNLSKCATSIDVNQDDYYYFVKPEMNLSASHSNTNSITHTSPSIPPAHQQHSQCNVQQAHALQKQNHHQHNHHQHQNAQHDSRVSSTRNDTTQNNTFDDLDGSSSQRSGDETSIRNAPLSHEGSDEVEELEAIDADFPYPLILDSNSRASGNGGVGVGAGGCVGGIGGSVSGSGSASAGAVGNKRRRKDIGGLDGDGGADNEDDDDDYDVQMLQQHRHLRQQNGNAMGGLGSMGMGMDMPPPQTVREVLNSKFCGFISAKLNSMEDSEADNLMNKILMLLVQTQAIEANK